jgi:hypothetical protein
VANRCWIPPGPAGRRSTLALDTPLIYVSTDHHVGNDRSNSTSGVQINARQNEVEVSGLFKFMQWIRAMM